MGILKRIFGGLFRKKKRKLGREVKKKDYNMRHKIGNKIYEIPDNDTMAGKIVVNKDGEPEIKYYYKVVALDKDGRPVDKYYRRRPRR